MTSEGRLAAIVLMVLGIGLYSAITAIVTSILIAPAPSADGLAVALDRLAALYERGDLTDHEYKTAKARVLAGTGE